MPTEYHVVDVVPIAATTACRRKQLPHPLAPTMTVSGLANDMSCALSSEKLRMPRMVMQSRDAMLPSERRPEPRSQRVLALGCDPAVRYRQIQVEHTISASSLWLMARSGASRWDDEHKQLPNYAAHPA